MAGVDTDPTNTGTTSRLQASLIVAGAPGSVAFAGQLTVAVVFVGGIKAPEYVTV